MLISPEKILFTHHSSRGVVFDLTSTSLQNSSSKFPTRILPHLSLRQINSELEVHRHINSPFCRRERAFPTSCREFRVNHAKYVFSSLKAFLTLLFVTPSHMCANSATSTQMCHFSITTWNVIISVSAMFVAIISCVCVLFVKCPLYSCIVGGFAAVMLMKDKSSLFQ